jgi:uncharacterized caspase-like protein
MLTKNTFILHAFICSIFLWTGVFFPIYSVRAEMHALIVGIDKYNTVGELDGAVNDAQDIASSLRFVGVKDIVTLFDEQVTRKSLLAGWEGIMKRAKSGDTIFFTYAGHGGEEPEHVKGSEKTGKDQTLLFPRYHPRTENNAERMIDDEIMLLLKQATDAKVSIVMVMDACHSGTMTRGIDTRVRKFKTRAVKGPSIENDHLGPIDPEGARLNLVDQEVLYLGAVQDNELAPEVDIDGKPHGALSVAFARGIKGAADRNHDRIITAMELESYVSETVKMLMEGQQHPSIMRGTNVALSIPSSSALPAVPPIAEKPVIKIQIINPGKVSIMDLLKKLEGVINAEDLRSAVLTWDVRRGHLLNKLGDIVAYANERAVAVPAPPHTRGFSRAQPSPVVEAASAIVPSSTCGIEVRAFSHAPVVDSCDGVADIATVQKVVNKWRVVEEIRQHALQNALAISLQPGDGLYHQGDQVRLNVSGQNYTYFTLFNLGSDGTINFLYPLTENGYNDPLERSIESPYQLDLVVQPPFGGDHFIAIASNESLSEFHRSLIALDGKQAAHELPALLKQNIKGKIWQVGVHGVYTAPTPK